MDFLDLDTKKTNEQVKENLEEIINIQDTCDKKINNEEQQQMKIGDEKQIEINLKLQQLKASEKQNLYSGINILNEDCLKGNSVHSERENAVEDLLKSLSTNSDLSEKQKNLPVNNENILTTTDSSFIQETNKDIKNWIGFQTDLKRDEVLDEPETIDKISEMIEISSKDSNDNKLKTKKKFHILLSRNCTEQYLDNSVGITTSNTDTNTHQKQIKKQNDNINKSKLLSDPTTKKKKTIKNNDTFEGKSRFEEVEDKLEEMFAGIEDEELVNKKTDEETKPENIIGHNSNNKNKIFGDNCLPYDTSIKTFLSTKAAKKSTASCSEAEGTSISKSKLYLKTMAPHRSLSIELNTKLLKFRAKSSEKKNKKPTNKDLIRAKGVAPQSLDLQTQALKKARKDENKNNNCSEYKRKIIYSQSKNRNNKNFRKTCSFSKTNKNQQKIKQSRVQRLFSSENDTNAEDRPILTKDIDTKHRSPFVLIKNNGSIAVVNTVTADDPNDKWPRPKKTNNYVYERKTVKGCHSSTLSNRYDADTADSTWICVFCKIGPHKKGLGDLFGPYVISNDCEEYRSVKYSAKVFQKHRTTDARLLNFSNKSTKYLNVTVSDIEHFENSDDNSLNMYMLGITKVSDVCYEVWIHEECTIWAPSIYVVGSRLTGLEDATWNSMLHECVYCLQQGALLCCLQRDCKITAHVPCARECNWLLDETRFWTFCQKHNINQM